MLLDMLSQVEVVVGRQHHILEWAERIKLQQLQEPLTSIGWHNADIFELAVHDGFLQKQAAAVLSLGWELHHGLLACDCACR